MEKIIEIFRTLQSRATHIEEGYLIVRLPLIKTHKLGISESGEPLFFIKCQGTAKDVLLDCNLESFSVQYNRECQLLNDTKKEIGTYTIISLKNDSINLQEYFLEIVYLIIQKLEECPKLLALKVEIDKLIDLFSKFSKPAVKTIQGVWTELFIIEKSTSPDYLIQSWHTSILDKFDFNDGIDKIEVKSTSKVKRIHNFSFEQLNSNDSSNLIVVSVFVIQVGLGKSILNLIESIEQKLRDKSMSLRLREIVGQTLGDDFKKSFDIYYDYQLAMDTIQCYRKEDIPTINSDAIPTSISHVKFECDLTNVIPVTENIYQSPLHYSLFQDFK